MSTRTVEPLFNRVLIKRAEAKDTSENGIILPETSKEAPNEGIVLSVGADVEHVTEGERIIYAKYGTTEIVVDGEILLILKEQDILARIN